MKPRKLVAGLVGAAAIATMAVAAPSQASAEAKPGDALVGAVVNNPQLDILERLLGFTGLVPAAQDFNGVTVFAPADQSFKGLVADLTNNLGAIFWSDARTAQWLETNVGKANLTAVILYHVSVARDGNVWTMADKQTVTQKRFFGINFLEDKDPTDVNPFIVGGPVQAGANTAFIIAGVLRPLDLKAIAPLD